MERPGIGASRGGWSCGPRGAPRFRGPARRRPRRCSRPGASRGATLGGGQLQNTIRMQRAWTRDRGAELRRDREREAGVVDLVEGGRVGAGDEVRGGAEGEQIQRDAAERGDRRVLEEGIPGPVSGAELAGASSGGAPRGGGVGRAARDIRGAAGQDLATAPFFFCFRFCFFSRLFAPVSASEHGLCNEGAIALAEGATGAVLAPLVTACLRVGRAGRCGGVGVEPDAELGAAGLFPSGRDAGGQGRDDGASLVRRGRGDLDRGLRGDAEGAALAAGLVIRRGGGGGGRRRDRASRRGARGSCTRGRSRGRAAAEGEGEPPREGRGALAHGSNVLRRAGCGQDRSGRKRFPRGGGARTMLAR